MTARIVRVVHLKCTLTKVYTVANGLSIDTNLDDFE